MLRITSLCTLTLLLALSCAHTVSPDAMSASASIPTSDEFNAYWYAGKAEICTYTLDQARYGDIHPGETVMVFVTEDFLIDKKVKKENATTAPSTSVLKLNRLDRFTTGIYDYSTMLSVFSPVEYSQFPSPLKLTFSAQDWCGQAWMQMSSSPSGYDIEQRSYFQAEGDEDIALSETILEDGLWTQARLDPRTLPQGRISILPSAQHIRLRHGGVKSEMATAALMLESGENEGERYVYTVNYESGRELKIYIQSVFPYRINGWEEKVRSGFGSGAKMLTTKATLKSSINTAYWGENAPADREKRKLLKLD